MNLIGLTNADDINMIAARCQRLLERLLLACDWIGRVNAWLLIPMSLMVIGAVIFSHFNLSQLLKWETDLPLLGQQLTVISVVELQWHLFGAFVLIGGSWVLQHDRHIRVDLLYVRLSPLWRNIVNLIGDLAFLLPFCAIMFWFSLAMVQRSYLAGEGSDYDALMDRYLIKSILPIGFGLLFLNGLLQIACAALEILQIIFRKNDKGVKTE